MRRARAPMGRFPSSLTAMLVTDPPCSKAMGGVSLQLPATQKNPKKQQAGTQIQQGIDSVKHLELLLMYLGVSKANNQQNTITDKIYPSDQLCRPAVVLLTCQVQSGWNLHLLPHLQGWDLTLTNGDELL